MENLFKRAMPWLGEEICIKDAQTQNTTMPGLSLVQWMNMNRQQSSTLANTGIQSEYLRSLSNPAMQNLGAAELARQLYVQNHLLQQNNVQLNASKLPQQMQPINEPAKGSLTCNQLDAITNHQELKQEVGNQQRQQQPVSQAIPLSQAQANLVQAQVIIQNQMLQQQQQQQQQPSPTRCQQGTSEQQLLLSQQQQDQNFQLQQQQQLLLQQLQRQQQQQQNQQQLNKLPAQLVNLAGQQAQLSDQELQLQLLQKLQQQSLISQPAVTLSRLPLIQEQQKLLLDMQQLSSSHSLAQQRIAPQQDSKVSLQASQAPPPMKQEQQKLSQKQVAHADVSDVAYPPISSTNVLSKAGSQLMIPGATQSVLTEEIPSCSTSPSTATRNHLAHPTIGRNEHCKVTTEKVPQSSALMSIPTSGEAVTTPIMAKELSKLNQNLKENVITSKSPIVGTGHDNLLNIVPSTDNLETASSATSLWPTQTDGLLHQGFPTSNFNQQQMFKDALPDVEIQEVDPTNNAFFGINNDGPLGFPMETEGLLVSALNPVKCQPNLSTDVENNYRIQKDAQQDISTSMVSQSFGQSDIAFNSIDSAINDGAMLNRNSWPSAPPPQRMRTFTKVCASLCNPTY